MSALNLRIDHGDELFVPIDLIKSDLSPAEVYVVLCFIAMDQTGLTFGLEKAAAFPEAKEAMTSLKKRGVVNITNDNGAVKIHIDMEKAMPATEEAK